MEFVKETSVKGSFIPRSALKLSGFRDNEEATLHTLPDVVFLTHRHMTAVQLVQTIDSLSLVAADLLSELVKLCGPCDDCGSEGCPFGAEDAELFFLDDDLREEAGIPEGAKLCAEVDDEAHTITFRESDYEHDLTDVPERQMPLLLNCGICLGALEEKLMSGEVVYHG